MKYISFLILLTLLTSCCGTKKVIADYSEDVTQNITKQNTFVDSTKIQNSKPKVDVLEEKKVVVVKQNDPDKKTVHIDNTKDFHQKLSKRTGYIHDLFSELLQKNVSSNGNVDYKAFKNSHNRLLGYISVLQMAYPNLDKFSRDEKLVYWINAYNAMTIDLILRYYPVNSIKNIKDPWKQRYWKLGDKWFNLDEIEHQIIRKMGEPRIHFALVCAAVSCPKLYNKAFTASSLEEDLTKLTREFLADPSKNSIAPNELKLSKIFSWFTKDFKQNGSLIDFLNQYSDIEISKNAKKRFMDYNWDLND